MENSTLEKLRNFKLTGNAYGDLFEKQKIRAISLIEKLVANGISLADIYVNDYQQEHDIVLEIDINDSIFTVDDFSNEKKNLEWILSKQPGTEKETKIDKVGERKFKSLIDCYGLDTIRKAIHESKHINFQTKRNIFRSMDNKRYDMLFENLELLPILESKTFSESDINSLLSDYFGETSNLSINSKMITDFNDRYGLMVKNSGKYETEDMNLLLDEWFNYWSQNGLISKSDTEKAEDRKLDNKESEVPNDIKNFFRAAGYKYVGHNQKFKVYTYSIGLGKDDPNFITATLDLTDKTLRLLNLNQKDVVQSADNLSSIKLPTTLDEFNTLLAPDVKGKETTSESIGYPNNWKIDSKYKNSGYVDGEDIFNILDANGIGEHHYIEIYNDVVEDFNRKLQEFRIKISEDESWQASLNYLKDVWFKDILSNKESDNIMPDDQKTKLHKAIGELSNSEIQDIYLYLYSQDKPYHDSLRRQITMYFDENPDDTQSMNYILNLANA